MQLAFFFIINFILFSNNKSRIVFAASFFKRAATNWWVLKINTTTGIINYNTFDKFLQTFKAVFNNPNIIIIFTLKL